MGKDSAISWTDHTYNPWYGGCTPRGPECRECYAKRDMRRYGKDPEVLTRAKPTTFRNPLKWKDPAKIFVCSWSDFFLESVPPTWRWDAWDIMRQAPQHTYIIPTKRPENILEALPFNWEDCRNVWLLISAGTQASLDKRWSQFAEIPAAVKGVSIEPMLEPLEMDYHLHQMVPSKSWIILGGESADGPRSARPFPVDGAMNVVEAAYDIPVFVKQMGTHWAYHTVVQDGKTAYQLGDRKGVRMEWWPEELRVQEFPVE